MSYKLADVVRKMTDLSSSAKAVLIIVCQHANDDGSSAYPSVATMAQETGLSRSTVKRALRELEEK